MWKPARSSLRRLTFTSFASLASLALIAPAARAETRDVVSDVIDVDAAPTDGNGDGGADAGPGDGGGSDTADASPDGGPRDAPFEETFPHDSGNPPADSGNPPRSTPDEDDGCGCRIGGRPGSAGLTAVLGALAGLGLAVRRRRR
jgi:MYXO-CTERM domain-containing protein